MRTVLLDTHTCVWSLFRAAELSPAARHVIEQARTVFSPCAIHEITAKHRSGKWPGVSGIVARLPQLLRAQGGVGSPYTVEMAALSGGMDWSHKEPFDRMIAATAIELSCPLVSRDTAIDQLAGFPGWIGRVWSEVPTRESP